MNIDNIKYTSLSQCHSIKTGIQKDQKLKKKVHFSEIEDIISSEDKDMKPEIDSEKENSPKIPTDGYVHQSQVKSVKNGDAGILYTSKEYQASKYIREGEVDKIEYTHIKKPKQKETTLIKKLPSENDINSSQSDPEAEYDITNSGSQPSSNESSVSSFGMDDVEPQIPHPNPKAENNGLMPHPDSTKECHLDDQNQFVDIKPFVCVQEEELSPLVEVNSSTSDTGYELQKRGHDSGEQARKYTKQIETNMLNMASSESNTNSEDSDAEYDNKITNLGTEDIKQPAGNKSDPLLLGMDGEEPQIPHPQATDNGQLPRLKLIKESKQDYIVQHEKTNLGECMKEEVMVALNETNPLNEYMDDKSQERDDDSERKSHSELKQKGNNMLTMAPSDSDSSGEESDAEPEIARENIVKIGDTSQERHNESVKKAKCELKPKGNNMLKMAPSDSDSSGEESDAEPEIARENIVKIGDTSQERHNESVKKAKCELKPKGNNMLKMAPSESDSSDDESDVEPEINVKKCTREDIVKLIVNISDDSFPCMYDKDVRHGTTPKRGYGSEGQVRRDTKQNESNMLRMAPFESDTSSDEFDVAFEYYATNSGKKDIHEISDNKIILGIDNKKSQISHPMMNDDMGDASSKRGDESGKQGQREPEQKEKNMLKMAPSDSDTSSNESDVESANYGSNCIGKETNKLYGSKYVPSFLEIDIEKQKIHHQQPVKPKENNMLKMAPSHSDTTSDDSDAEYNVNQSNSVEPTKQVNPDENDRPPSSLKNFFKSMLSSNKVQKDGSRYVQYKNLEISGLKDNMVDKVHTDHKANHILKMTPSNCDISSNESYTEARNDITDPCEDDNEQQPLSSDDDMSQLTEDGQTNNNNERPSRIRRVFMRIAPCIFKNSTQD